MTNRGGVRQTARGVVVIVAALVLVVIAYIAGIPAMVYAAVLCGAMWSVGALQVFLRRWPRQIERSIIGEQPSAGDLCTLGIRAPDFGAKIGRWVDRTPERWEGKASGRGADLVEGAHYAVRPHRRGHYQLGPLDFSVTDPLGLWQRRRVVGQLSEIVVWPRVEPLSGLPQLSVPSQGHGQVTDGMDPGFMPREYRAGDPMSRIHWKATARRDQLMVREEHTDEELAVLLVLDLRRSADQGSTDRAVTFIASVASHMAHSGLAVRVCGLGCAPSLDITVDVPASMSVLLDALAQVEPGGSRSSPPRGAQSGLIIVGPRPSTWPAQARFKATVVTGRPSGDGVGRGWFDVVWDGSRSLGGAWQDLISRADQRVR